VIRQHRAVIEQRYGRSVYEAALAELGATEREELLGTLAIGWVQISVQEAVYAALSRRLCRPASELHAEVARLSTMRNFATLWRALLRLTTDSALIARAPLLYTRSYAQGRLSAEQTGPGRVRLTVCDWPDIPEFSLRGLRIGIETVLQLAGRQDAVVTSEYAAGGALLRATWRV
jgi:hypothetical protein